MYVSFSRTQCSDAGEVRTRGPSVSSQGLYHWVTALPGYKNYWAYNLSSIKLIQGRYSYKDKRGQPFLQVTHRLDPIHMPTKYYQNISKGIKDIERTASFCLQKAQI